MDTSETYIELCAQAEEIQNQWKPQGGDVYRYHSGWCIELIDVYSGDDIAPLLGNDPINRISKCPKGHTQYIWLPRQDQLQAMVHTTDWISTLEKFAIYAFHGPSDYTRKKSIYYGMGIPHNFFSMEQLWLAFVMHERYQKIWDGEKWQLSGARKYVSSTL